MKCRSIKTQPTSDDDGHSEQYEVVFIIFEKHSALDYDNGRWKDPRSIQYDKDEKILAT